MPLAFIARGLLWFLRGMLAPSRRLRWWCLLSHWDRIDATFYYRYFSSHRYYLPPIYWAYMPLRHLLILPPIYLLHYVYCRRADVISVTTNAAIFRDAFLLHWLSPLLPPAWLPRRASFRDASFTLHADRWCLIAASMIFIYWLLKMRHVFFAIFTLIALLLFIDYARALRYAHWFVYFVLLSLFSTIFCRTLRFIRFTTIRYHL